MAYAITRMSARVDADGDVATITRDGLLGSLLNAGWLLLIATIPIHRTLQALPGGDLLALFAIGIALASVIMGRVRRPFAAPAWIFLGLIIPVAGFVAGIATSVPSSLRTGLTLAAFIGLFPFALRFMVVERPRVIARALIAAVVVQTVSAASGLAQAYVGIEVLGNIAREGRANGLAGHPNVLALMASLTVIVVLAAALRGNRHRWLCFVGITVNLLAVFASGSLSGLLTLAIGLLVLFAFTAHLGRAFLALAGATILVATVAELAGLNRQTLLEGTQSRSEAVPGEVDGLGSWQIRLLTWEEGWRRIQLNPVGGWGMDSTNQAVYNSVVVHNVILRYWYQGGILLFVAALVITMAVVAVVLSRRRGIDQAGGAAIIAVIWAFAMSSAFYIELHYWLPFLLAFAFISPRSEKTRSKFRSKRRVGYTS